MNLLTRIDLETHHILGTVGYVLLPCCLVE